MNSETNHSKYMPQGATVAPETTAAVNPDVIPAFHHHRSIRACVFDGWRVFALAPKRFLAQLLPYALLVGAALAYLLYAVVDFCARTLVPAHFYLSEGQEAESVWQLYSPQTSDYAHLGIALLVAVVICFVAKAALWEQIKVFKQTGALPTRGLLLPKKSLWLRCFRLFAWNALLFLAWLLPSALIGAVAWLTDLPWLSLLALPIALVLMAIGTPGRVAFMVGDTPFKQALATTWQKGARHCGGYIIVILITAIPLLALAAALLLPYASIPFACFADAVNVELGEASGLPEHFAALHIGVATIALCGTAFISTFQTWALAFKAANALEQK